VILSRRFPRFAFFMSPAFFARTASKKIIFDAMILFVFLLRCTVDATGRHPAKRMGSGMRARAATTAAATCDAEEFAVGRQPTTDIDRRSIRPRTVR
jgi:hypothetical protein